MDSKVDLSENIQQNGLKKKTQINVLKFRLDKRGMDLGKTMD